MVTKGRLKPFSKIYLYVFNNCIACQRGKRIPWILCCYKSLHMSGALYFTKHPSLGVALGDRT